MKPDISVIVAVYNAEKTIRKCVDSLLAQTFTNLEILLIDDGSIDNCGKICDEYALSDSRIRVVHKKNGGVSSARQCGIENAQGEYTIHADPDDWVEPEMLEELYNKASEENADMVICDYYIDENKYVKQQPTSLDHKVVLNELFQHLHGSCCNKLVKRDCYVKYDISFPEQISYCEDQYVMASILLHDIKVAYCPMAFYHYMYSANSQSRHYDEKTFAMDLNIRNLFTSLFEKDDPTRKKVYDSKTRGLVSRAFYFGQSFFTSKTFKSNFYIYRHVVIQCGDPKYLKCLKYLSCIGFYKLASFCFKAGFKTKQVLKILAGKK